MPNKHHSTLNDAEMGEAGEWVKNRAVFFIGGYDPKSSQAFFERLTRESARFETLWGVEQERDEPQYLSTDVTCQTVKSTDREGLWKTQTDFYFLSLDDIVLKGFERNALSRLGAYGSTFANYLLTGTAFRMLRHAWRFFLYFAYPPITLLAAFLLSLLVSTLLYRAFGGSLSATPLFSVIVGLVAFFGSAIALLALIKRKTSVFHLMDLWSFSNAFTRGKQPAIEDKLECFATLINQRLGENTYDEILLIGHSTGGALILDTALRTFEQNSTFTAQSEKTTLLTLGSTALKVGLHPASKQWRWRLKTLFAQSQIRWVEYQCLTDAINFYRTNPSELMALDAPMTVRNIKIKNMLTPQTYERIRRNLFRVHYQFVFGNTKRYHFDFPAICFGPATIGSRAAHMDAFADSLTGKQ